MKVHIGVMYLIANLCALICVIVAGYMAINNISGWGWFLFVAVLTCASEVKLSSNSDSK